jgi:hypothetical protein
MKMLPKIWRKGKLNIWHFKEFSVYPQTFIQYNYQNAPSTPAFNLLIT